MNSSAPPIDYPGDLALEIYRILNFFFANGQLVWKVLFVAYALALLGLTWKRQKLESARSVSTAVASDGLFLAILIAGLVMLRLPNLVLPEQNIDESHWISTAAAFAEGRVMWKEVTGTTGGPLAYAPLSVMLLFGGLNYAVIRLFGLLVCVVPTVLAFYYFLRIRFSETAARLGTATLSLFFAVVFTYDLIAYTSEHMPMLLTAVALLLLARTCLSSHLSYGQLLAVGIVLGLFPYAKLQSIHIGFNIGLSACIECWLRYDGNRRLRAVATLIVGAILPTLVTVVYLLANNAFAHFWYDYIDLNLLYMERGVGNNVHGLDKLPILPYMIRVTPELTLFVPILFVALVTCLILTYRRRQLKILIHDRLFWYLAATLVCAWLSVISPGSYYVHYVLLFVIPLFAFVCYTINRCFHFTTTSSKQLIATYISVIAVVTLSVLVVYKNKGIKFVQSGGRYEITAAARAIKAHATPGDHATIWGWGETYFVQSGTVQATSSSHTFFEIMHPDSFVHARFIDEMERTKPLLFVDAVTPKSFFFKSEKHQRHDDFPAIRDYIRNRYALVDTAESVRVYKRKP